MKPLAAIGLMFAGLLLAPNTLKAQEIDLTLAALATVAVKQDVIAEYFHTHAVQMVADFHATLQEGSCIVYRSLFHPGHSRPDRQGDRR